MREFKYQFQSSFCLTRCAVYAGVYTSAFTSVLFRLTQFIVRRAGRDQHENQTKPNKQAIREAIELERKLKDPFTLRPDFNTTAALTPELIQ